MTLNKQEIRDKLNKKYNSELWRELFSEIFPNKEFFSSPLTKTLNETESKIAISIKQIGQVELSDNRKLALFEVELKSNKDVNRNRVELRNLISKDLLSGVKDGALVTYYSKEKTQYRFTFVSKQTKITETGDFEESETDTKRFTYVLGETESCNTPADRFFRLSEIKDKKLSDIEDAFSVEKVSKEFFAKYKEHFNKFNEFAYENFKNLLPFSHSSEDQKEKNIRDFNKKLLGRIVFIYFLQKKGWIGVPKENNNWSGGSTRFLSEHFNKSYKGTSNLFYLNFLEPLFYDTLNRKRENNIFNLTDSKIPFLNGGLFEEEEMEKRCILFYPNELFQNLFEYFDQYNFTIIEDSVEEQEVAIDPEMLGHIFENLLEDNKDKGTFYTPKEIVKYMCQEALINYLDTRINVENVPVANAKPQQASLFGNSEPQQMALTKEEYKENIPKDLISSFIKYGIREDNKNLIKKQAKKIEELLDDVKILDPAIGSGAFPMGMLHEIFNAKLNLDWTIDKAETKRKIIENSIYGVDIEKGAVDIAMLRFWLSLVVDEEEPSPLPNLDYKIMVGNSLTGDNIDTGNMFHKHFLDEIQQLRHKFYKADEPEEKKRLKNKIEDETNQFAKNLNLSLEEGFNFKMEFSEVFDKNGGFDIVIANPPYVGEKSNKEIFRKIKNTKLGKEFYQRKLDLFYLFFHKAIDLSKQKSQIVFITTNYYVTATAAEKLRNDLKQRTVIKKIVNFNELRLFESARGQHNMITILTKNNNPEEQTEIINIKKTGFASSSILISIFNKTDKDLEVNYLNQKELFKGNSNYINIISSNLYGNNDNLVNTILDKIVFQGIQLDMLCNVDQGILTGIDKVSKQHVNKFPEQKYLEGEGVYVINESQFYALRDKNTEHIFKPWFKNSDIYKYITSDISNEYVLYLTRDLDLEENSKLFKHLEKFNKLIDSRSRDRGEIQAALKLGKWWVIFGARKSVNFNGEKIVVPQRSKNNIFAYNNMPWFAATDVHFITTKDNKVFLKYILALLNSKLYFFWLLKRGKRKGDILELVRKPLSEIPIKKIQQEQQTPFIEIVDQILESKKKGIDTSDLEKQIDQMVYKLYDLTEDEISIIEGN
jgi:adenine-specific DNA-methyltransferase